MRVALIGASGALGACIVDELLSRGHEVTGICRRPENIAQRDRVAVAACDAVDGNALGKALAGHDAIILALRYLGLRISGLFEGLRGSGVERVIVAGHSGTLNAPSLKQLADTDTISSIFRPEALDAREAYKILRKADDLAWTYVTPAALLTPGQRTGVYRLGGDELMRDQLGESRISMEDFAIVIVDELEQPKHIRERFSAAY